MFGWDFQHSKTDRIKLFFFIFAVFLVIGFTASFIFRSMNTVESKIQNDTPQSATESVKMADSSTSSKVEEDSSTSINEYDQTEQFSKEQLDESKEVAISFTKEFHAYNADKPMKYLENAKPYMTSSLYEKMERTGRRETLERSYLTVKDIQVTPVVNKSSMVVRWNVMVMGEAKATDGTTQKTEDWYLIGVRKVDGEWKVEDVRVNVPN